uniref:Histone macroH2A1.1 n=1 Tax=Capsaspora owczarzaki (strain ATCC 30864) TaxID=595528 RepID=UPI001E1BDF46|nr:Chain A, Histone macroH2A1.1 [Capsaspora owczarzaki ATCC 30864]7NY7_A Chain A, Histone macroH2A1.1 [Capsaspora owczarzaki ATCC 30864]
MKHHHHHHPMSDYDIPTTENLYFQGFTILSKKTLHLGQTLYVVNGDLTEVRCDAVVHPTNGTMSFAGQVGGAIRAAAGAGVDAEVNSYMSEHSQLQVTKAAITSGHNLPSKWIVHVHSPNYSNAATATDALTQTIRNALTLADTKSIKTIAFPSIGSGNNHFPKHIAAQTILQAISAYFMSIMSSSIKEVYFVLFDQESINVYNAELINTN